MRLPLAVAIVVLLAPGLVRAATGPLVIVGGGSIGPDIVSAALALSGGRNAIVAVLPQSSAEPDAGDSSVKMWLEAGAKEAVNVSFDDRAAASAALRRATLIWIPGGDQNRFMKAIDGTGLDDLIRERHRAGLAVGGTSAGAAVIAGAMFTGDADLRSLTAGSTVIGQGLGLWPAALIDQHFLKRQRDNRLISAVFDQPSLVGVGIDESTAIIVRDASFDVIGRSSVVVIDARGAKIDRSSRGGPVSGTGVKLAVLHAGQRYSLERR
ncbi:MAG TPA: cyanophycinase [Vicinamibacterales bacterium]|nr:cyanophycinase [Vicinamibacterales bacterium]